MLMRFPRITSFGCKVIFIPDEQYNQEPHLLDILIHEHQKWLTSTKSQEVANICPIDTIIFVNNQTCTLQQLIMVVLQDEYDFLDHLQHDMSPNNPKLFCSIEQKGGTGQYIFHFIVSNTTQAQQVLSNELAKHWPGTTPKQVYVNPNLETNPWNAGDCEEASKAENDYLTK